MKAISFDLFDMTPLGPSGTAFLAAPPALRLAPSKQRWIDLFIGEHEACAPIMLGAVSPPLDDFGLVPSHGGFCPQDRAAACRVEWDAWLANPDSAHLPEAVWERVWKLRSQEDAV